VADGRKLVDALALEEKIVDLAPWRSPRYSRPLLSHRKKPVPIV